MRNQIDPLLTVDRNGDVRTVDKMQEITENLRENEVGKRRKTNEIEKWDSDILSTLHCATALPPTATRNIKKLLFTYST